MSSEAFGEILFALAGSVAVDVDVAASARSIFSGASSTRSALVIKGPEIQLPFL